MLNTGHPMYIFWGGDGACLYNDAYRRSIGPERHPGSLGRPAREVWHEIWNIIGPQIEQVISGGGATWHEDHLVPITRYGRREDVYWTYSYSPIDDDTASSGIGGVLVICTETTQKVVEEQRLSGEIERLWRHSRDLQVVVGADGIFRAVSPAWKEILGHEPDRVVGQSFLNFIWPEDTTITLGRTRYRRLEGGSHQFREPLSPPRWHATMDFMAYLGRGRSRLRLWSRHHRREGGAKRIGAYQRTRAKRGALPLGFDGWPVGPLGDRFDSGHEDLDQRSDGAIRTLAY